MRRIVNLQIPYGRGKLKFSMPDSKLLGIVGKKTITRVMPRKLIADAFKKLDRGSSGFKDKSVLIVVSDLTRHAHVKGIVPLVLSKIGKAAKDIEIVVGTGLHKPLDRDQLKLLLGDSVVKRYKVFNHDQGRGSLMDLGVTDNGIPRILNNRLRGKDILLTVGVIEPHLYAGYSGGAKTVAIGLAGEAVISATHSIRFLDDPSVRLGSIRNNAFQDTLWKLVSGLGPRWLAVNVVNDPDGHLSCVLFGDVRRVYDHGVRIAKRLFEVEVGEEADIAICGIGYPKDVNLYQSSRALNYILNVDRPIVRKGGVVIIAAELSDGMGDGITEKRFGKGLKAMRVPRDFVRDVKKSGCIAGAHRAYMVAGALKDHNVIFVNTKMGRFLKNLPFPSFKTIPEAVLYAETIVGEHPKIYVVPRSLCTVARVKK